MEREFSEVWQVFPRHVDRGHALKAYKSARKTVEAEVIRLAVLRFSEQAIGTEERYIPHFATWLKGQRWLDETEVPNGKEASLPPGVAYITDDGKPFITVEERERREESEWRRRLTSFRRDPRMWVGDWGPPPTDERCFLAIDPSLSDKTKQLLVEFGFHVAESKQS